MRRSALLLLAVGLLQGLVAQGAAPDNASEKAARLGVPFRISLFPESPDDVFVVGEYDSSALAVIPSSNASGGEDARSMAFRPLKAGTTSLSIDRQRGATLEKGWLRYRIVVLPETKGEEVTQAIRRRTDGTKKKNDDELAQVNLAQRLALAKMPDAALREIDDYLQKFPTGAYVHDLARLKGEILLVQKTNAAASAAWHESYAKRSEMKDPQRAEALLWWGRALLSNRQAEAAAEPLLRLVTRYPNEKAGQEGQMEAGNLLVSLKRYAAALPYFQSFYEKNKPKGGETPPARLDEAIYQLGMIHESDPANRDVKKALEFYGWLLERTPFSVWTPEAKKRIRYLKANFLEVR